MTEKKTLSHFTDQFTPLKSTAHRPQSYPENIRTDERAPCARSNRGLAPQRKNNNHRAGEQDKQSSTQPQGASVETATYQSRDSSSSPEVSGSSSGGPGDISTFEPLEQRFPSVGGGGGNSTHSSSSSFLVLCGFFCSSSFCSTAHVNSITCCTCFLLHFSSFPCHSWAALPTRYLSSSCHRGGFAR